MRNSQIDHKGMTGRMRYQNKNWGKNNRNDENFNQFGTAMTEERQAPSLCSINGSLFYGMNPSEKDTGLSFPNNLGDESMRNRAFRERETEKLTEIQRINFTRIHPTVAPFQIMPNGVASRQCTTIQDSLS